MSMYVVQLFTHMHAEVGMGMMGMACGLPSVVSSALFLVSSVFSCLSVNAL